MFRRGYGVLRGGYGVLRGGYAMVCLEGYLVMG